MNRQERRDDRWRGRLFDVILRARNRHLFMLDVMILALTPMLSLLLRVELAGLASSLILPIVIYTLVSVLLKLAVFRSMDFYNRYWRYASVDEVVLLGSATLFSGIVCILAFFAILRPLALLPPEFPKSIPFIDGMLTMILIGGLRLSIRLVYVLDERIGKDVERKNVLIVGAGLAGSMIIKELRSNPHLGLNPVALVDDDPAKQRVSIHGVKVVGTLEQVPRVVKEKRIQEIIIALPSASGKVIRNIVTISKTLNVASKTIPGVFEILSGSAVAQLRDVQIEDLLRRGVVQTDETNVGKLIRDRRVMVTGAGGSIGSELCRQILTFLPKELVILGHGENSIFQIAKELRTRHGLIGQEIPIRAVIADIRDRERMHQVFKECEPQIMFHAAAHKHVGLMESNWPDAVTNNVLGTQTLVELAGLYWVEKFVMISSDKAVNPTSVMGVTKRVAELVVHEAALRTKQAFVVVRFGNVLGSRGSVVPILKDQIRSGGPVTITDPNVTRFFMTIPEAVQLVLQAGAMGSSGETYVLDMGQPVRILDLARDLIRLSGLREGRDIDIAFSGLQEGEKLHEELFYVDERAERSSHEKIYVCRNGHSTNRTQTIPDQRASDMTIDVVSLVQKEHESFRRDVDSLVMWAQAGDSESIQNSLKKIVPQYCRPSLALREITPEERKPVEVRKVRKSLSHVSRL